MELIVGFFIGVFGILVWRELPIPFRPSMEWTPHANCDDPFRKKAYLNAGKNLGVRVKCAAPTPCPGYSMCGGMTGIWLHREDMHRTGVTHDQFSAEFWREHDRLTS